MESSIFWTFRRHGFRLGISMHPLKTMADLGLAEAQTLEDLDSLVAFAKEIGARHVVYSPAKIVKPRNGSLAPVMQAMKAAYATLAAPAPLQWTKGSWRLPRSISDEHVVNPFLATCAKHGMPAKFCMQDLIETP